MHAAVVLFPGSNADAEMVHTLRNIVGVSTQVAWHKDSELPAGTDLVAIPGGFSFGDYLRAGAIAKASPITAAIRRHAERGGLTLGVCNGFQVLTETGLLPGALTRNQSLRFECRTCHVSVCGDGPFSPPKGQVLNLPVAHAEGRYQIDEAGLRALESEDRVAFRYCGSGGESSEDANFNGSIAAIAGVYAGPRKNIMGLMPHPERASEPFVLSSDGRLLFDAVVRWHAAHGAS